MYCTSLLVTISILLCVASCSRPHTTKGSYVIGSVTGLQVRVAHTHTHTYTHNNEIHS